MIHEIFALRWTQRSPEPMSGSVADLANASTQAYADGYVAVKLHLDTVE